MQAQRGISQVIVIAVLGVVIFGIASSAIFYFKKRVVTPPEVTQKYSEPTPQETTTKSSIPSPVPESNFSKPNNTNTAPHSSSATATESAKKQSPKSSVSMPDPSAAGVPAYTLVAYTGEVFGAKMPASWKVTSNQSGIEIIDPADTDTGVSGVVAVGWFGSQTPDGFIDFLLQSIGASNVKTENESAEGTYKDPSTNLPWTVKTKTFTFEKNGKVLKAKASAGVLNGYGQYVALMTAFQTVPSKWSQWAPTLERIAKSITIINPSMAGGAHTVRLPTAADLVNDSSPLMEVWEERNQVQKRTSHEFSDAIMGQETDLYSPSTGSRHTLPLNAYDPVKGGYHNPDKWEEILIDPYQR